MRSAKMTPTERRAIVSLSTIMALRMIGLFMVLPVFSLYTHELQGATPFLIGLAMGIYGLAQAFLQIPFGALSDRLGRKPIILAGLLIFAAGSILAACAHSITLMIIGRALQGAGAVGSTILALMADLTTEEQRTKAMAISGITIGFSFSLAMLVGPLLIKWFAVNDLFFISAFLGIVGILVLYFSVPTPTQLRWHRDTEPELHSFLKLLASPDLAKLNIGILILHAIFTASFIVIPISLQHYAGLNADQQWSLYLPTLLMAFIGSLVCIGLSERKQKIKPFFLSGIMLIGAAEFLLWAAHTDLLLAAIGLGLFFTGFSLLEAFLPSLVSRTAPAERKGSALGIYSCAQFLGIFIGGVLGGWIYGKFSLPGVYLFCVTLAFLWLVIAFFMQPPRYLITRTLRLNTAQQQHWQSFAAQLQIIPGIVEVTFIAKDGMAYLKMERATAQHPDFIRLQEQLQSE